MAFKWCIARLYKLLLFAFLKNAEALAGFKVYFVCITCREKDREQKRRAKSDLLG
jgi:hypothetical protein